MIKSLAEFGWDGYWIDTDQIYAVFPIRKDTHRFEAGGPIEDINELRINLGGVIHSYLARLDDDEKGKGLVMLRDFFVSQMQERGK